MGYSATPPTRPRVALAGLAYGCSFYILFGLVMILEPRIAAAAGAAGKSSIGASA